MKAAIVLCFIALAASALARPEEKYTSKYDNFNYREAMDNPKLFTSYFNCLMERGKCTPDGKELKSHIVEALQTECAKCTDAQKKGVEVVISHLIHKRPEMWKELCEKYDPTGEFAKKYEARYKEISQ